MSHSRREMRKSASALGIAVMASLGASSVWAANVTSLWSDGGGNSNWNTAANWVNSDLSVAFPNNNNGITYDVVIGAPAPTIDNGNFTIDNLTVNTAGTLTLAPGVTLSVLGPSVVNNSLIQIDTFSNNANLHFAANSTISGAGTVELDDVNPNAQLSGDPGVVVTVDTQQTIAGVGEIDVPLVNKGTINGNFPSRTLDIFDGSITNTGTIEASSAGMLQIGRSTFGVTVNNTGGTITNNGGTVNIESGTSITGGTLAGSLNLVAATISDLTVALGATMLVPGGDTLTVGGATLTNNGTIQLSTVGAASFMNFTSNVLLNGSGRVFLDTFNPDAAMTASAGVVVTNGASHTIDGIGDVDVSLINNGIVNADTLTGSRILLLQTSDKTNNNIFESTNGATLNITGITIAQSAGASIAAAGTSSTVNLSAASISGGTIGGPGVVNIVTNSTLTSVSVAAGASVQIEPAQILTIAGPTFTNNGTITVDVFSSNGALNFANSALLTGSGAVVLADYNPFARLTAAPGAIITQGAGHTIEGIGEIDAPLVNNGSVLANNNRGAAAIQLNANVTNSSTFAASNGASLILNSITFAQSASGQILTTGTTLGAVNIIDSMVSGGAINGAGRVTITSNSTFSGVVIGTGSSVQIAPAQILTVTGSTFTNKGTITVDQLSSNAAIDFANSVVLDGGGEIVLNDFNPGARIIAAPGAVITQDAANSVHGVGEIDAAFINNGIVDADFNGGSHTITLQTNNMTNNNLMEATNTGNLEIKGITLTQNGTLLAANASTVSIDGGATIVGGLLNSSGSGSITASLATLSGVTVLSGAAVNVPANAAMTFAGSTLTDNGTLTLAGLVTGGKLVGSGAVVIQNDGVLQLVTPGVASTIGSLTLNAGGIADVTTNKLVIPYGAPAADPVASIAAALARGYNGGAWNGEGINSSNAAINPTKFAVGFLDGDRVGDTTGKTIAANQIAIQYTLAGDAFLESTVGFDDLIVVAQNFGKTGEDWAGGNFNYDPAGSVGFADLIDVAQNFGATTGIHEGAAPTGLSPAWQTAAIQSTAVNPEPTSLALAAIGAAGFFARRRRRDPKA